MGRENPDLDAGMRLYREGRFQEALGVFARIVTLDPAHAQARGLRGLALCHLDDFERGVEELRAAVGMAPRDAMLCTSLGTMLFVQGRIDEAEVALRRALVLVPGQPDALATLSLALKAQGDFAGAERAARAALVARPGHVEARINLGYALLAQGKFAEGWEAYSARPHALINLRDPGVAVTVPHQAELPVTPTAIIVHGEQGLGDTLFFLRFVPKLRGLGHRLAFWGDARLHPLLSRCGLFEHLLRPEAMPGPGLVLLWAGDLPHLLGATQPSEFPPPLPLAVAPARLEALRARLAEWGPAPYVGLTWRAGIAPRGRVVLAKQVDPALLGAALAHVPATFVSLQRGARPEELQAAGVALGATLHDAGFVNDDLDDALAMVALLDEYVGVSNTNTHLRAGVGRAGRVLVPWPPEWRWLKGPGRSAWFAVLAVYRQAPDGDWSAPLERMRDDLAPEFSRR